MKGSVVHIYEGLLNSKLLEREVNKLRLLQKTYSVLYSLSAIFVSFFVLVNLLYFSGINIKIPEPLILVFVTVGVLLMTSSHFVHKYLTEKEEFISSMVEVIRKG